ncbi:hypothetical protein GCK32_014966 [Trichostrongylus colubriformis]|uniref:Transmembrane protein n=1 Tax=Trichostrongylus colubriformis TaxID=6319 RepID=A0AAN8FTL5_TRICO
MAASALEEYSIKSDEGEQEAKVTTQQCDGNLKGARAGGEEGGGKCAEIVLIIIAVIFIVNVIIYLWNYKFTNLEYIIIDLIIVIIIIVGIARKSSFCMLIAMIVFLLTVIISIILLAVTIHQTIAQNRPISDRIVGVIEGAVGVVLSLIACCSATTLRREYA